jgi:Tfp pilus assembly protein PilV
MEQSITSRNKATGQKGFTIIETATAMMVMMIGGLGIVGVFSYAIKNTTGSRDRAVALAVAQQRIEQLRNLAFDDPGLTATATNVEPVTVTSGGRSLSVRTTITDTTSSVKTIQIQVTPLLNSGPWAQSSVQLSIQRSSFALGPYSGGP